MNHDHGFFGELIEHLLSALPIPAPWDDFLNHFIIDTISIFVLLLAVMLTVYFFSSYLNMDLLHRRLARLRSLPGFLLATAAGVISPFCSCSITPVLMGLVSMGVPVSVCLVYLTASSLMNLTTLVSLYAVAGVSFGTAYLIAGLTVLLLSALCFSFLRMDSGVKTLSADHEEHHHEHLHNHQETGKPSLRTRFTIAWTDTREVLRRCWAYILLGVALSAGVAAFFSIEQIVQLVHLNEGLSILTVSLIGIPIHSDIFSIAPVLRLLIQISPAVALAFTLSAMALSIPSAVILTRVLKGRTVALYCCVTALLALAVGFAGTLIL